MYKYMHLHTLALYGRYTLTSIWFSLSRAVSVMHDWMQANDEVMLRILMTAFELVFTSGRSPFVFC